MGRLTELHRRVRDGRISRWTKRIFDLEAREAKKMNVKLSKKEERTIVNGIALGLSAKEISDQYGIDLIKVEAYMDPLVLSQEE